MTALNRTLQDLGEDFQGLTDSLSSGFDQASEVLDGISNKTQLSLDAAIDLNVGLNMSVDSFNIEVRLDELTGSFTAAVADDFRITTGPLSVAISPSLEVYLEAINTAVPFDLVSNSSELATFDFRGTFDASVNVGVEGVPAEILFIASSDDITNASSIDFEIG